MKTEFNGIIIVIPTRNRAAVAEAAIKSALQHDAVEVSVLVSDNSTSAEDLKRLANFCSSLGDPRLTYVTPPQSLRMAPHWDWALQQALKRYPHNHVTFLTDRMMLKSGALAKVAAIAAEYPDSIISYMHDRVADNQHPIRVDHVL
jgi:GT2 family glycosyltransferase